MVFRYLPLLLGSSWALAHGPLWPEERLLPRFPAPQRLEVLDLERAPGDIRLFSATLQGLVNRRGPVIYLHEPAVEGKEAWLKEIGVPREEVADVFGLLERHRELVKGLVIYDPEMPDSVNVATTLAGLKDAVVVSPELAGRVKDLPVLDDLRGKFRTKLEAYRWLHEHAWPEANRRMLVGLSPGRTQRTADGLPPGYAELAAEKRDIRAGENRSVRTLDLSRWREAGAVFLRFEDSNRRNGWGPAVSRVTLKAGDRVILNFTPGTGEEAPHIHERGASQVKPGFRFVDQDGAFTYRFELPAGEGPLVAEVEVANQFRISAGDTEPRFPWVPYGHLRDYAVANRAVVLWLDSGVREERDLFEKFLREAGPGTPYLGWFGNDLAGEVDGVELLSRAGCFVVPSDWANNLTALGGEPRPPMRAPESPRPTLEAKIHVTFTFSEGDNLQYNQHRMRVLWDDPARGKVPINWTCSPLLLDAAPVILGYYRRTASPNDLLCVGPSGAGYFSPEPFPRDQLAPFLRKSRPYLEASGMSVTHVLNRAGHRDLPLGEGIAAAYRDELAPGGIFLGWGREFGTRQVAGVPVSELLGIGSIAEGRRVLDDLRRGWDGRSPLFASVGIFAWDMTPSDVAELAASLGPEFRVVRGDHYFFLLRESQK